MYEGQGKALFINITREETPWEYSINVPETISEPSVDPPQALFGV